MVKVNGIVVPPVVLPPDQAVHATAVDFSGGPGVQAWLAGAGANSTYRHGASGFVFTLLYSGGIYDVQGPEGEYNNAQYFLAQPSNGTWTYNLTASYALLGPQVYLISTPE